MKYLSFRNFHQIPFVNGTDLSILSSVYKASKSVKLIRNCIQLSICRSTQMTDQYCFLIAPSSGNFKFQKSNLSLVALVSLIQVIIIILYGFVFVCKTRIYCSRYDNIRLVFPTRSNIVIAQAIYSCITFKAIHYYIGIYLSVGWQVSKSVDTRGEIKEITGQTQMDCDIHIYWYEK